MCCSFAEPNCLGCYDSNALWKNNGLYVIKVLVVVSIERSFKWQSNQTNKTNIWPYCYSWVATIIAILFGFERSSLSLVLACMLTAFVDEHFFDERVMEDLQAPPLMMARMEPRRSRVSRMAANTHRIIISNLQSTMPTFLRWRLSGKKSYHSPSR